MTINELIILGCTGLCAGIASGTLGIGGGVIVIPALVFFMGMTQHEAQGTTLAFLLPPIGILAAMNYYKSGNINVNYALILAIFFVIGGYLGSLISINMPVKLLRVVFALFMIVVAGKMIYTSLKDWI